MTAPRYTIDVELAAEHRAFNNADPSCELCSGLGRHAGALCPCVLETLETELAAADRRAADLRRRLAELDREDRTR